METGAVVGVMVGVRVGVPVQVGVQVKLPQGGTVLALMAANDPTNPAL